MKLRLQKHGFLIFLVNSQNINGLKPLKKKFLKRLSFFVLCILKQLLKQEQM